MSCFCGIAAWNLGESFRDSLREPTARFPQHQTSPECGGSAAEVNFDPQADLAQVASGCQGDVDGPLVGGVVQGSLF